MKSVIAIASTMALLAVSSGHFSKILRQVHIAQMKLLKDSQTKSWVGLGFRLKIKKQNHKSKLALVGVCNGFT